MLERSRGPEIEVTRDGRSWRVGTASAVSWITYATTIDRTITAAIPPIFDAYATFHQLDDEPAPIDVHERTIVEYLAKQAGDQPWWLGFLDTGAHDVVFDNVLKVSLYSDWFYVFVEAGPTQALEWRTGHMRAQYGVLPDLFFPVDRSWLVSALWDDTWTCVGGPAGLIRDLQHDPLVQARPARRGRHTAGTRMPVRLFIENRETWRAGQYSG